MATRTTMMFTMLALAAAPLAAQQPANRPAAPARGGMHEGMGGMPQMAMMDSMMGPMMQAMSSAPEHLLGMKDRLHLTAAQQTQLTTMRDAAKAAHDPAASQAAMHLREMVTAMHAAQPDTGAVMTHFTAAFRFMQAAHWSMVRAATEAWPVLTAAQQQQVTAMADSMGRGGMRNMRQGEMRH